MGVKADQLAMERARRLRDLPWHLRIGGVYLFVLLPFTLVDIALFL